MAKRGGLRAEAALSIYEDRCRLALETALQRTPLYEGWRSLDPGAAACGPFGGLVASGWHTAALVMRQLVDHYLSAEASLGSPGLDEMRWPDPVRPGDTLRVRATVAEARRSQSRPDRGIMKTVIEAVNQDGRTVMRATATNFLRVRPDA